MRNKRKYPYACSKPTVKMLWVNAEVAAKLLNYNVGNRMLKPKSVLDQMKRLKDYGLQFGATQLSFNHEGKLINGQHTLWAIIKLKSEGTVIEGWISLALGCSKNAIYAMDRATRRTRGDDLKTMDIPRPYISARAGGILVHYYENNRTFVKTGESNIFSSVPSNKISKFIRSNEKEYERAASFISMLRPKNMTQGLCTAMFYIMAEKNYDSARVFWSRLILGVGFKKTTEPMYLIREDLEYRRKKRLHMREQQTIALLITAWNDWTAGKSWKTLPDVDSSNIPSPVKPVIKEKFDATVLEEQEAA